jgi:hypothetical protein
VWDVTQDFRSAYLAGTSSSVEYRLKPGNAVSPGGIGFYGGDADSLSFRPYIALIMDTTAGAWITEAPRALSLRISAWPNPANPEVNICYQLKEAGTVSLRIFDSSGKLVKSFAGSGLPAGLYKVKWNTTHEPPGIYIYKMKAGAGQEDTGRLVLLR